MTVSSPSPLQPTADILLYNDSACITLESVELLPTHQATGIRLQLTESICDRQIV